MKTTDKQRADSKAWRQANPEKCRQYAANHRRDNPEREQWRSVCRAARQLGQPEPEFPVRSMPEVCEVCGGVNPNGRRLSLDYDHVTGKFRGWLCANCNTALGHVHDDPERLIALIRYLGVR